MVVESRDAQLALHFLEREIALDDRPQRRGGKELKPGAVQNDQACWELSRDTLDLAPELLNLELVGDCPLQDLDDDGIAIQHELEHRLYFRLSDSRVMKTNCL